MAKSQESDETRISRQIFTEVRASCFSIYMILDARSYQVIY